MFLVVGHTSINIDAHIFIFILIFSSTYPPLAYRRTLFSLRAYNSLNFKDNRIIFFQIFSYILVLHKYQKKYEKNILLLVKFIMAQRT